MNRNEYFSIAELYDKDPHFRRQLFSATKETEVCSILESNGFPLFQRATTLDLKLERSVPPATRHRAWSRFQAVV